MHRSYPNCDREQESGDARLIMLGERQYGTDHGGALAAMSQAANGMVIDVRGVTPAMRRPLVFAVVDRMIDVDCHDSIVIICDHDPSGLGYQLDLRRESRGLFEFDCDQRLDGAWVALIRRRII